MEWWLNLSLVDIDNLAPVARAAEAAGFAGVSLGDHLLFPRELKSPYPYSSDGGARWSPRTHWPHPALYDGRLYRAAAPSGEPR
jgi:alkanesulfonate monooxygenase SsuD/methylene tetrahydromethanopterin reductase-like flavin-dependent oxidoreductase (luciferase family)